MSEKVLVQTVNRNASRIIILQQRCRALPFSRHSASAKNTTSHHRSTACGPAGREGEIRLAHSCNTSAV
jgi:hypothetical protein